LTEPTGIGAQLRHARESQGLSVADAAQQLKFAPRQIESLENERFERLPGPTIARGMVRNYARLLNLDPEPLVERMSHDGQAPPDSAQLAARYNQAVPFSDSGRRSSLVYAGFSVAVLALVGVVAYEWQQQGARPQFVAPAQQPVEEVAQPAQPLEPAQPPEPPQRVAQPQPVIEPPKVVEAIRPPEPQAVAEKPVAEKPVAEKPLAAGGIRHIVLRCEEESWLEVTDASGQSLVTSLSPAGSERVVRARGPLEIVIGNARGVTLLVDDKPVDLKPHTRVDVARVTVK
jgi:cytoskeleton protein RodZ